ncbi:hypothetical protein AGABI1DRAFT_117111 [Agaricus bisporus var. burnettii JB137-S8]|uniref:SH3 domain-containing protein n=1 Tax=Agaricus bisporus var. burnettii (strain JB137-S8 / ATCC MYA-4627 / FGSC 10392) TaxID=597362 RepID=K5Y664_AGABU|nr:uncharacterized protein AGABI1DRAFT_117111 [Agaricus bisporus var. burnettii JB137-S8]EKM83615.1 hypothetical protein AGABI1DRAFT_117111 [Agaricus bisporus var. burnettii JB137-S8]
MKLNTPLPQSLSKECAKAAKILRSFVDSRNNGLDGVVPRSVLQNAKGFAIFTVAKAGFLLSARAGSGVVIAKMNDGSWSAPSAIGTGGIGFGGQAGAEVTDFLVVLNTRAAIRTFMAAGSLTLGGNMSIALGPLGRNGEAIGSVSSGGKIAAMYSYSKTRGLFGGISVEGSVIVERQDANARAYGSPVTVKMLLGGTVDPPSWADPLIKTLDACTGVPRREWVHDGYARSPGPAYAFATPSGSQSSSPSSAQTSYGRKRKPSFPPSHWSVDRDSQYSSSASPPESVNVFDNNFASVGRPRSAYGPGNFTPGPTSGGTLVDDLDDPFDNAHGSGSISSSQGHRPRAASYGGALQSKLSPRPRSYSLYGDPEADDSPFADNAGLSNRRTVIEPRHRPPISSNTGGVRAIAVFDFDAVEDGDLSFNKGDVIAIVKRSNSTDDWWTGRVNNREGIFPANFVEIV